MKRGNVGHVLGLVVLLALFLPGPADVPWARASEPPNPDPLERTTRPGVTWDPGRPAPANLSWVVESVDLAKAFRSMEDRSLALDSNGSPHIAFGDDDLYYAWHDGTDWHVEVVDAPGEPSGDVGEHAALGLDAADHPHIGYFDRGQSRLKYAHYNGSSWRIDVVDSTGSC